jgi:hypothetical protein
VLLGLWRWLASRPVQESTRFQATVVPLANIMDVGFIVMAPAIVLLTGYAAPLYLLGICLLAIAAGSVIAYNIRHYEPLEAGADPVSGIARVARLALVAASIVNIAYYTLLFVALVLWPLGFYSDGNLAVAGTVLLVVLIGVGVAGQMDRLNELGDRTTAFNLAAVTAVIAAFLVFNVQEMIAGRFDFPPSGVTVDVEALRKIIALFALVQGFEAARYIGVRFSAKDRIVGMRVSQAVSSVLFVAFLALSLILFVEVPSQFDQTAIFVVAERMGPFVPFLILLAAVGSEGSAIINATVSRSDMLVAERVPRRLTFVVLLVPAIAVFLLTDITQVVALASRVFALYFLLQAVLAAVLARRSGNALAVAGFALLAVSMATITIFGISV